VPGTHYFFTSGKDGKIKQWDADIFQKITTLQVAYFIKYFTYQFNYNFIFL